MARSALMTPRPISDTLAEFMGKDKASYVEVNKEIWRYIKANKIKKESKYICDDVLRDLLGVSSFKGVGDVGKAIKKQRHFL